jgi:hypothetical protein
VSSRTRVAVVTSVALWLVCVAAWAILLDVEKRAGCPGLTDPSGVADSEHWQWLPPGNVCMYRVDGAEHIDEPPNARLAVLALLLVWPAVTLGIAHAARADQRTEVAARASG